MTDFLCGLDGNRKTHRNYELVFLNLYPFGIFRGSSHAQFPCQVCYILFFFSCNSNFHKINFNIFLELELSRNRSDWYHLSFQQSHGICQIGIHQSLRNHRRSHYHYLINFLPTSSSSRFLVFWKFFF